MSEFIQIQYTTTILGDRHRLVHIVKLDRQALFNLVADPLPVDVEGNFDLITALKARGAVSHDFTGDDGQPVAAYRRFTQACGSDTEVLMTSRYYQDGQRHEPVAGAGAVHDVSQEREISAHLPSVLHPFRLPTGPA